MLTPETPRLEAGRLKVLTAVPPTTVIVLKFGPTTLEVVAFMLYPPAFKFPELLNESALEIAPSVNVAILVPAPSLTVNTPPAKLGVKEVGLGAPAAKYCAVTLAAL